jgi:uncharacterized protein (TIGR03437 family)
MSRFAGKPVDAGLIQYAGLAPGLFQINLLVPDGTVSDREIIVSTNSFTGSPGRKPPLD